MTEELRWHPENTDPAFKEGYDFIQRNAATGDGFHGKAPFWYGWMVRQAFWCGVKWAREKHSLPVVGTVGDGGTVHLKENQP